MGPNPSPHGIMESVQEVSLSCAASQPDVHQEHERRGRELQLQVDGYGGRHNVQHRRHRRPGHQGGGTPPAADARIREFECCACTNSRQLGGFILYLQAEPGLLISECVAVRSFVLL